MDGDTCPTGSPFEITLGWALGLGVIPFAYLPQYCKMCQAKTHRGISLLNFHCFCIVTFLQLLTYFCAQYDATFGCCSETIMTNQCVYAMAPVTQTVLGWLASVLNVVIYFRVFDGGAEEWHEAMCRTWVDVAVHFVLVMVPVLLWLFEDAKTRIAQYGMACSSACCFIVATHWCLQIVETCRVMEVGSLSIFSLVVSSLGSLVTAVSMWPHGGLIVTLPYICAFLSIGVCACLAIYIDYFRDVDHEETDESELEESEGFVIGAKR